MALMAELLDHVANRTILLLAPSPQLAVVGVLRQHQE